MDSAAVYVVLGACAGGFVQGLSGFAFGLVSMAFWAWALTPQLAAPMVVFGSLLGQIRPLGTIRRGFDARRAAPFVAGGLLGMPLGVALLHHLDPVFFKLAIGGFLVVYCPAMLAAGGLPRVEAGGRAADAASGFAGGIMGGLAGMAGPAPHLWGTRGGGGQFPPVAPAMLIPNLIGARLYSRVTETTFRRLVLALLSCTGIAMLAAALPRIVAA